MSIVKTVISDPVTAGNMTTYSIEVVNNGPSFAQNVVIADDLPSDLSGTEYSLDGGISWSPWLGTYNAGTVANAGAIHMLLRGTLDSTSTGILTNIATVNSDTPDPDISNNTSIADANIQTSADISIVKRASTNSVIVGNLFTYAILVRNLGPSSSSNVVIEDIIPPELSNVDYEIGYGGTWQPWNGSYTIPALPVGQLFILQLRVNVTANTNGILSNTATINADTPDPNPDNNSSTSNIVINPSADIGILKEANLDQVSPGDVLTYTLIAYNNGPDASRNIVITDTIPADIINPQFSVDLATSWNPCHVSYMIGLLEAESIFTVLIQGTVADNASGTITNTATAYGDTGDPNYANNTVTLETPVIDPPGDTADLAVVKTACPHKVEPCGDLTYTIIVTNNGPNEAINVVLEDALPVELIKPIYSINDGRNWDRWQGSLALGNMAPNSSKTILIYGCITKSARGQITNTAKVSSDTPDPNLNNNQFEVITRIRRKH